MSFGETFVSFPEVTILDEGGERIEQRHIK